MDQTPILQLVDDINRDSRQEWKVLYINSKCILLQCNTLELQFDFDNHDFLTTFTVRDLLTDPHIEIDFVYIAATMGITWLPPVSDGVSDNELFVSQIIWFIKQLERSAKELINGDFSAFDSRTKVIQLQNDSNELGIHAFNLPVEHPINQKFWNHDFSWIDDVKNGLHKK